MQCGGRASHAQRGEDPAHADSFFHVRYDVANTDQQSPKNFHINYFILLFLELFNLSNQPLSMLIKGKGARKEEEDTQEEEEG